MKKLSRRLFAALFCLLAILSFSACSTPDPLKIENGICTIPNEDIQFTMPEASFAFSQGSYSFSDDWNLAGISDPVSAIQNYEEMGALAHIASTGGKFNIYITKKESTLSSEIYNLTEASEASLQAMKDDLNSMNETEGFTVTVSDEVLNDILYATADIHYEPLDGSSESLDEICYVTVINGISYTFETYSSGTELSQEQLDYFDRLINSVKFLNIMPPEETELSNREILMALLPIFLLIALIVLMITFSSHRKKKIAREKNELTEKLSEYRARQKKEREENPNLSEPKTLFVNKTIHTDAAIQQFSYFHIYKRHPFVLPSYIISGIAAIIYGISLVSDSDDILLAALFVVAGIYGIVKVFTSPSSTYRTLQRVYKKLPNRVALYSFREEDFRLSGLQATGVFPYFQITNVYETKDKFYLYFGEESTYFIDKENFSFGELDDFRTFIKEKMGKKYKRRMF